jgi:hypothetical protein
VSGSKPIVCLSPNFHHLHGPGRQPLIQRDEAIVVFDRVRPNGKHREIFVSHGFADDKFAAANHGFLAHHRCLWLTSIDEHLLRLHNRRGPRRNLLGFCFRNRLDWFRSGTAYATWEKGEILKPEIPEAAYQIPMMCNPGAKEEGDKRFNGAFSGEMAMFRAYRAKGAPISFAADPRTSHECDRSAHLRFIGYIGENAVGLRTV